MCPACMCIAVLLTADLAATMHPAGQISTCADWKMLISAARVGFAARVCPGICTEARVRSERTERNFLLHLLVPRSQGWCVWSDGFRCLTLGYGCQLRGC